MKKAEPSSMFGIESLCLLFVCEQKRKKAEAEAEECFLFRKLLCEGVSNKNTKEKHFARCSFAFLCAIVRKKNVGRGAKVSH